MAQTADEDRADRRQRDVIQGSSELISAADGWRDRTRWCCAMGGAAAGVLLARAVRRAGLDVYDRL